MKHANTRKMVCEQMQWERCPMNGLGRPKFLEALLFVNNFAIRYTKGKGVRARLRYAKRKREREGEGCMMSKIEGKG